MLHENRYSPRHPPDVLIDNFDIVNFIKTNTRFDIWLDEQKVQMRCYKSNSSVISYGFGDYHIIRGFSIRGRATFLPVRERKLLDKSTGEVFSYDWDLSQDEAIRLNAEFVAFLRRKLRQLP